MHCHEYLKEKLQLLLNELKSEKWTRNCTKVGEKFESNWGLDWRQTLPAGFVSGQPFLVAALEQLVAHNDVDDVSLATALRAVSSWCANIGEVEKFLREPQDRDGHVIEITEEVAALFEDMVPMAREIESMLLNPVYCPQIMRLRGMLARLNDTPTDVHEAPGGPHTDLKALLGKLKQSGTSLDLVADPAYVHRGLEEARLETLRRLRRERAAFQRALVQEDNRREQERREALQRTREETFRAQVLERTREETERARQEIFTAREAAFRAAGRAQHRAAQPVSAPERRDASGQ